MITRFLQKKAKEYLGFFPVTAILGPRQCGKTTLAQACLQAFPNALYLDLERPSDLAKLSEPELFLQQNQNVTVCLDEIQRAPELFATLRSLCDQDRRPGRFLVLGSASPALLHQSSETLAGRIGYLELTPFRESEMPAANMQQNQLWLRGGFPPSLLAPSDQLSRYWLDNFITTFLERDIPQMGIRVPGTTLRSFWEMCAHLHGELWNHAKVASALGVTGKTVSHYLDILEAAYMIRRLSPFATNLRKRLVKSPKVYIRDSGILHRLLRIEDANALMGHPVCGVSWEGYVIEQIAAAVPDANLHFFRTAVGAEMDLIVERNGKRIAIEIKHSAAPKLERGFWHALDDIQPDEIWVVAPISQPYPITRNIMAAPVAHLCREISK